MGSFLAYSGFAYRSGVPANLQLPPLAEIGGTVGVTQQLTKHFAVGLEQRSINVGYGIRYRNRNHGYSTAGVANGLLYQFGLSAQWLLPLGLRWELAVVPNASLAVASFGPEGASLSSNDALIWRPSTSTEGQSLTLHTTQPHQLSFFTGAELRLLYWLGGGPHGLQLTVGHQQGLRTLVRADSREFSYFDANGQRQQGTFGVRYNGSYSSVQLGYCYAWGESASAPKRRWSSPRYSQPPTPAEDEPDAEQEATPDAN